ncbi:ABC transporter permease [Aeromicrobium yanjiei]|uniref:ABC transporter permease n=1 Tax=Aeromicrobium yanjiei TaxID=2662028 RepID=A0A5Q2MB60_9ACTN|nr:ABC transporter permease [Aeromicrobium yanjiei]QGG40327.1 ABC transporter permease [Aeromicrobium yanjiei]
MTMTASTRRPRIDRERFSISHALESAGIPILLVLLVLYFGFVSSVGDLFLSSGNLHNIFANQSVTGLIAIGMVIPLVAGYFDLSVAAIAGLSSVTFASVSGTHGQPVISGIVAAIGVALVAGGINALLVAVLRLNPFIATFGMYILIGGLLEWYTDGSPVGSGLPNSLGDFGNQEFLGIAILFWLLMVLALVAWYVLTQTPFGRVLTAIGSNENAARLAGFRVDRSLVIAFMGSALFGGMAGVVLTTRSMVADSTQAQSFLFPALAAVFLGQTAIRPGLNNVWGTMFGVFLVAVAVNGLQLLGADTWVTPVFNGAALVISVALSTLIARARSRKATSILVNEVRQASVTETPPQTEKVGTQ